MENAIILIHDLCRLCLDEPGVDNIFHPVDFSQDILTYTGIKINRLDELPKTICNSCRDIMTCVKVLKEVATANDKHLQLISENNGDEDNQNGDSDDSTEISSSSKNCSFKNKIIFENDDDDDTTKSNSKTEKQNRKKRKLSSKLDNIRAPKTITVRKDLCEFSSTTSPNKNTQTPTSTSSSPKKIVKVGDNTLKVHKYEFKCETCNKSYATSKKLYLHQLAHNKKFSCTIGSCTKKFATKGDLRKHLRSHTGERPYKCDLCDQRFSQNVTLKAHKESKHIERHS